MLPKAFIIFLSLTCFVFAAPCHVRANVVIHSMVAVEIELLGYDFLTEKSIFKGKLPAGGKQDIETSYHGLALLFFDQGQGYPVIIGDVPLTIKIRHPAEPPAFLSSAGNEALYKTLTDKTEVPEQYFFAALMIQAKNLLESSYSIRTVAGLRARKNEFLKFVGENHERLQHSDMIRRLIAHYFMMHEYVDYHVAGEPATEIKKRYQGEVLSGVADWLTTLSPHISKHDIVNYCVSLYYNRSMVTLASQIIDRFADIAFCPGEDLGNIAFPDDLQILQAADSISKNLSSITGHKIITFISEQCPVSMATAVSKARELAAEKAAASLVIAPLEKLSDKHLMMNRMIRNGNLLFVSDEKWRQENLTRKMRLPVFVQVKDEQ